MCQSLKLSVFSGNASDQALGPVGQMIQQKNQELPPPEAGILSNKDCFELVP